MDGRRLYDEALVPGDQFQIGTCIFAVARLGQPSPAARAHADSPAPDGVAVVALTLHDLELLEQLHAGATFLVHRARLRTTQTQRPAQGCAIKFLSSDAPARGERAHLRARFARHVHRAQQLRHPGIVRVLGGDASAESPYVIEALMPGASLRARAPRLSSTELLHALCDVANALVWLHARGLAHGCLTPGNVLFGADSRVQIANVGLASALGEQAEIIARARRDGFCAPEARAQLDASAAAAADVYALGALTRTTCPDVFAQCAVLTALCATDPAKRPAAPVVAAALAQLAGGSAAARADGARPGRAIRLQVLSTGQIVPVSSTPFALGRVQLNPADRTLSRLHATLRYDDDAWSVSEAPGAPTGVLMDGIRIAAARTVSIGDVLQLGNTRIRILA
jgi:serine/threonine protein kinase